MKFQTIPILLYAIVFPLSEPFHQRVNRDSLGTHDRRSIQTRECLLRFAKAHYRSIDRLAKGNYTYTPFDVKPRGSFQFACCGINGSSNYGTSWWRLQEVGRRELVVPLSCCTLTNVNQTDSFLNPEPANLTLCQALNPAEHQYARHTTVRTYC